MTQKTTIVLHLFAQYNRSHQSCMPPMCAEAAATGSSQHPILTCPVPSLPTHCVLRIPALALLDCEIIADTPSSHRSLVPAQVFK